MFELQLVGEGPEFSRLVDLTQDWEVLDRVKFLGRADRVLLRDESREATAFVTASDSESLSKAALEAMACGLPIVAVDSLGMCDLGGAWSGCICFSPNIQDLAAAMSLLIAEGTNLKTFGEASRIPLADA